MIKSFLAMAFILHSWALLGQTPANLKTETELKLALSRQGHNALKVALTKDYQAEHSERSDTYFDIFKNARYILKDLPQPQKLRLMQNESELKWQDQKVIKTGKLSIFSLKTIEASELELANDENLQKAINSYFDKLTKKDSDAIKVASDIEKSLIEKKILLKNGFSFFPTHHNHKKRIKIKLKIDGDQFNIQLGETNNRGLISYELEAEIKTSKDLTKSAERLNAWLLSLGLDSTYIDSSVPVDPTEFSEVLLNELFVFGIENL